MIRLCFLVLFVLLCVTQQLPAAEKGAAGQFSYPSNLPENAYYPVYPGYPVYRRHVEGKLYTAKDYWAAKREAFKEGNRKGVGSAMEHGSEQISSERNKRYERDVQVAKDVLGTNQTDRSTNVNQQASDSTQSPPTPFSTTGQPVPPPVEDPVPELTGTARRPVSDTSAKAESIRAILDEHVGVPYSSDGEDPKDGFSPVGLIKHVARRIGVVPGGITNAADLWEKAGLFIQSTYGNFQTGDLLFFKLFSKSAQKDELFVALAYDDTYMVYPSYSRKKVIKRSYKEDFWKQHFVGAKRVPPQMR